MKPAYLITDTTYKMLNQASCLEIMYRYDTKRRDLKRNVLKMCHLTLTHMIFTVLLI